MDSVLDRAQLTRIESVHAGFLYQHLYAVAALLSPGRLLWTTLRVERDEDLEISTSSVKKYIQVKKRAASLTLSDIEGALLRFDTIRNAHQRDERKGSARFWIVSSAEPGPSLGELINSPVWQPDVHLRTPLLCTGPTEDIPQVSPDLESAVLHCIKLAEQVPHSSLAPETLVWKLAAIVQLASSGAGSFGHEFVVESLTPLLEQLVVQLQSFPIPPEDYRPQEGEPTLASSARIRIITGFSGAGKTSWAAEIGKHSPDCALYFDAGDLPSAAVASALTRELAARMLPVGTEERKAILLPGVSGIQSLKLIDRYLHDHKMQTTIVLDNAHSVSDEKLAEIASAIRSVNLIVLARPWPGSQILESLFGVASQQLSGWLRLTIADEAAANGAFGSMETCQHVRTVTGGLPLFVRDACRLACQHYSGDLQRFIADVESRTTPQSGIQDLILNRVFQSLTSSAQRVAGLLSLATLPILRDDLYSLCSSAFSLTNQDSSKALRELSSWGVVRSLSDGTIVLHDSFRILAAEEFSNVPSNEISRARETLFLQVSRQLHSGGLERFRLFCNLLADTGRIESLIDVVTRNAEMFREYGLKAEMAAIVHRVSQDPKLSHENRFWAEDTLAFWDIEDGDTPKASRRLQIMRSELKLFSPNDRAELALIIKELLVSGRERNEAQLRASFARGIATAHDEMTDRIIRYNFAYGLLACGKSSEASVLAAQLVQDYYDVLGITPGDVLLKTLGETAQRIGDVIEKGDDIKRLADSLDLHARALNAVGESSVFSRLHAHKFYVLSDSFSSAVRVGQDFIDECLGERADPDGARDFAEQFLLPLIKEHKMLGVLVPASCQYAVVLAYCGDSDGARRTLAEMRPFVVPGTEQAREFQNQSELVESIAAGFVRLGRRAARLPQGWPLLKPTAVSVKIGRNEQCPCGSGKKYKRCHGG